MFRNPIFLEHPSFHPDPEAHKEFCEAQYTMGRNESFLIDPIPLIERYSKLSAEIEDRLQGRAPEIKDLHEFFHKEKYTWTLAWALLNAAQVRMAV